MKIALTMLAGHPYFWMYDQLTNLTYWFTSATRSLTSIYGVGGLVIGLVLLIVLVRKVRNA